MFGRRRHAAAEVVAAPTPKLTDAQILELVHGKVAEMIGERGEWTVSRRQADDTDTIFHSILAQSVSVGIAAALVEARNRIEAGEPIAVSEPQHLAPPVADRPAAPVVEAADDAAVESPAAPAETVDAPVVASPEAAEPAAFSWEPAPITVWTDLRKPVTGEFPLVSERSAA